MESITGGNTPKYQELTEQLRLQIVSGEIAPGQKLPSENTLSAQYQVSRQTVRKALVLSRLHLVHQQLLMIKLIHLS